MRLIPNVEKHLVKGLRDGRKEAFDAIYKMYGKRLLAYCVCQVGCSEDAEDIIQEVFLNLWRTRSELKDVDSLRPLLFTAARNRIINLWKSRLNSNLYSDYVTAIREKEETSGSAAIEYREFERQVMKEIEKLPPTQQNVVRLSRMENLDTKEIAERLNLSVQTVKNALSAGLKTLRSALGGKTFLILLLILLCHLASES
jgi:RNA polymerase sigma-70 factor